VPQREPLSAPLLGALAVLAGLLAAWIVVAIEALAQGSVGALAGFSWHGLELLPSWLVGPELVLEGAHGAGAWTALLLSGPLAAVALGFAVHALAEGFGAPPPVRFVAYEVFAIAWLQLPLLMLAGGLSRGGGPFAVLYGRLGEPESGRWAMVVLGLLILWGVAGLVADQAVAVGGEWLRTDGRAFRRRVALVLAAYPLAAAVLVGVFERAFEAPLWALGGAALAGYAVWLRAP
jgi:hypothetical protein